MRVRRPSAAAAVAVSGIALVIAPACGAREGKLGAGEDVGFCLGWKEFEALEEPVLTDRREVVRWSDGALRIVDRIDLRVEIDDREPPARLKRLLRSVERELEAYRDTVEDADDEAALRRAAAELAASRYTAATTELTGVLDTRCTREDRGEA